MNQATVLVVGSGAREHALAWKLAESPSVARVIVAPGNDGMGPRFERMEAALDKGPAEFEQLCKRARQAGVTLAVIGPDNALADGIVDVFEGFALPTFGPMKAAARIESSKAFAKEVMQAAGVPTAQFAVVASVAEAEALFSGTAWASDGQVAVKADGLALGKGVRVCGSLAEAREAVAALIGISGKLVIEERLDGEEISWMAFCDGRECALFETARDFKRVGDGDVGPNTGGMGSFSPVPGLPAGLAERVRAQVFMPVLREMEKRDCEFRGLLYAGLMINVKTGKFWVIEFNARFGDPEAQALLPRIEGDIFPWFEAVSRGDLSEMPPSVPFVREASVYVVAAAKGYPDSPVKGQAIEGFAPGLEGFFAAGVSRSEGAASGSLVTAGGRVLGALGMGATLSAARTEAYSRLSRVKFSGMQSRSDIAQTAAALNTSGGATGALSGDAR